MAVTFWGQMGEREEEEESKGQAGSVSEGRFQLMVLVLGRDRKNLCPWRYWVQGMVSLVISSVTLGNTRLL